MKTLVTFFSTRPLAANLIAVAVVIAGLLSMKDIQKEGFPRVELNQVIITTIYPGASPRDIELNVTNRIEEALKEVSGIKEVRSISSESTSIVTAEIDDNADNEEARDIFNDIDSAVGRIADLPKEIDGKPIVTKVTSDDMPILEIAISGVSSATYQYARKLQEELEKISGVSKVTAVGLAEEELHILVDPKKAQKYQVDLRLIAAAISKRNLEGSGGTLESFLGEKKIVSFNKYHNLEEVLSTNVRMSPSGQGVKLRQVAEIRESREDLKLAVRNQGKPGISLLVLKSRAADTIKVVENIIAQVEVSDSPPGVEIHYLNDQSRFTRNRLKLLGSNALMGFVLVVAILFFTFGFRTATWTAFGIPFSILGLFALMPLMGITLNAISLGGCVLVLGMLVDDAVVVSERISSFREEGLAPIDAAVKGVEKVWRPVLASSITTMVAFSPIIKLGGLPGKFVWMVPAVVTIALVVSLFESYFILPSHLAHGPSKNSRKPLFIAKIEQWYQFLLQRALRFRYPVLLGFLLFAVVTFAIAKKVMQKEPFPQEAAEGFHIQVTLPKDYGFERATEEIKEVEKILLALPKEEVVGFSTRLGTHSKSQTTERGTQPSLANIAVYLTVLGDRDRNIFEIIGEVRDRLMSLSQVHPLEYEVEIIRMGPPLGKPFEVRVSAMSDTLRLKWVEEIKSFVNRLPGVLEVGDDRLKGKDEINLVINHDLVSQAGLTVEDILVTLRIAFDGQMVTDMVRDNEIIDFRLRLNKIGRADIKYLKRLEVMNRHNVLVPLKNLVTFEEGPSQAEIRHIGGLRTTSIYGQIDKNKTSPGAVIAQVDEHFKKNLGVTISFAGESVENKKIFGDLGSAAILAVSGVFIIISLIFNSIFKPFIVIAAIPFDGLPHIGYS
jgi:multidrug efflux pump subunit AcrB